MKHLLQLPPHKHSRNCCKPPWQGTHANFPASVLGYPPSSGHVSRRTQVEAWRGMIFHSCRTCPFIPYRLKRCPVDRSGTAHRSRAAVRAVRPVGAVREASLSHSHGVRAAVATAAVRVIRACGAARPCASGGRSRLASPCVVAPQSLNNSVSAYVQWTKR